MGIKNFLIEGVSGAGKTTVAEKLERLGYQVIHGDRELRYRGHPETGQEIPPEFFINTPEWMSEHQLWDLKKVKNYVDSNESEFTFFCGGSRNHSQFIPWLNEVFILDLDKETMMKRIEQRVAVDPTDFGATPEEKQLILSLYESKKDLPESGVIIDSTQSVELVVDDILNYCKNM